MGRVWVVGGGECGSDNTFFASMYSLGTTRDCDEERKKTFTLLPIVVVKKCTVIKKSTDTITVFWIPPEPWWIRRLAVIRRISRGNGGACWVGPLA